MLHIRRIRADFEREPLRRPFGFKGGYLSELWQTVTLLEGEEGHLGLGLGTQSTLWSDPALFAAHTETGGNVLMNAVAEHAAQMVVGRSFDTPVAMLEAILPELAERARRVTGRPELRTTFVLNALVSLDLAAWMLFARSNGHAGFDAMLPEPYRPAFGYRHAQVASIPVIGYGTSPEELAACADAGFSILKIKLGHPGTQAEMLDLDRAWLAEVHRVLGPRRTSRTSSGRLLYYLDVNGRYEEKETLLRLLDHARRIGAGPHLLLVEEPFPEHADFDVSDVGVLVAADERAHTDEEVRQCIELGYGAVALKPVAKTLSMTLKIARTAHARGVPCFCADLTVNPVLVDWNKCVAARMAPLPGLSTGLLETNGHQNYLNWEAMKGYHPRAGASWTRDEDGVFELGDDFYAESGGILDPPEHYLRLVDPRRG